MFRKRDNFKLRRYAVKKIISNQQFPLSQHRENNILRLPINIFTLFMYELIILHILHEYDPEERVKICVIMSQSLNSNQLAYSLHFFCKWKYQQAYSALLVA